LKICGCRFALSLLISIVRPRGSRREEYLNDSITTSQRKCNKTFFCTKCTIPLSAGLRFLNRSFRYKIKKSSRGCRRQGFSFQQGVRPHRHQFDDQRPIGLQSGSYWASQDGGLVCEPLWIGIEQSADVASHP